MLNERIGLNGQANFLAVRLSGLRTLVQWYQFIPSVGIVVGPDHAKIGGFQFAYHLHADAHLELTPMEPRRSFTLLLAGDQFPPFLRHPGQVLQAQISGGATLQCDPLTVSTPLGEHQCQCTFKT